jgi:UDP-N-acetylglucosamine 2-epimerase (non-hydrolysing)
MRRVMVVFGTRPEAIKLAPVILALQQSPCFEPMVTVTAQHREMLDQVLELFGITPQYDLDVLRERQTLTELTTRALHGLSRILDAERPDAIIVQGDTTTTFVGALAGFYHRVPVVHIEAGLRTGDRYLPFPEEINRCLTTPLTTLHLAPTPAARDNLLREHVRPTQILVTGNTGIDALLWVQRRTRDMGDPWLERLATEDRPVLLVTAHRRESWGRPLVSVAHALAKVTSIRPDIVVVFPIHRNPVVRESIVPILEGLDNVVLLEPLSYGAFVGLMARCHVILTDSGGIQEEGPSLGKPVLVMREVTERPEAVAAGTARLVGTDRDRLVAEVCRLFDDPQAYRAMANAVNPYGDGQAARRAVAALTHFFGEGPRPDEFGGVPWATEVVLPDDDRELVLPRW